MPLLSGINHVALVTSDLARFIDFFNRVFGLEVIYRESSPMLSHAILRISETCWLHPAELPDNPHAAAVPTMFQRGHLDHLSLTAHSPAAFAEIRTRLIAAQASDGRIDDLGAFRTLWFVDPDGMRGEITLIVDPALAHIHAPQPLAAS